MFTEKEINDAMLRVGCGRMPNLPNWYKKSLDYFKTPHYKWDDKKKKITEIGSEKKTRGRKKKRV